MSDDQKTAADNYLAAIEQLTQAREREMAARREQTACMNAVTEAERQVRTTQEAFTKAFGLKGFQRGVQE